MHYRFEAKMNRIPTFTTARLQLTPLQLSDAAAIQQLFPQWEVVRYLDSRVPWPYPDDGALTYVRDLALPAMARGEEWHWMIRLVQNPLQCIGSVSLHDTPGNHRGFWLAPQWQGKGYMREVCEVINRFWFDTLNRPTLQVPKAVSNLASRRISLREGMHLLHVQPGNFVSGPMPQETWELTQDEWRKRRGDASPATQPAGELEATLHYLEQRLLQQDVRSNTALLSTLLADDFMEIGASGKAWHKADVLSSLPVQAFRVRTISVFQVRPLAPDVALVTYTCHSDTASLRSSVWRRLDGHWQMTFHQGTPAA